MELHVGDSKFWSSLWRQYGKAAPSIALCRVPELEYASSLKLEGSTLDHCCGDGVFASLAWPDSAFSAGCDISEPALLRAKWIGRHDRLDAADAGKKLPYEDASFDLVFDNSALEHIPDLDASLKELARVTKPGGVLAFNILNHRFYYDWWPLDETSMKAYCGWQPVYHILSLEEWRTCLAAVGFDVTQVQGYFNQEAAGVLAALDFEFSGYYLGHRPSQLVSRYKVSLGWARRTWRQRIEKLEWQTDSDAGAGYFVVAERRGR